MREIGGYIGFERFHGQMLHSGAIALNSGRACLEFLVRARGIRSIALPMFLCASMREACEKSGASWRYYSIDTECMPAAGGGQLSDDEWILIVNYYGQKDNFKLKELRDQYGRIIVDNTHAYFQPPLDGTDTIYSCRKFFGVSDGGFLYTDAALDEELPQDESFERMRFLLGRFERGAQEFYAEYAANNAAFVREPIKRMSSLTQNLLRGIDHDRVCRIRTKNFVYLNDAFSGINELRLTVPNGPYMYPLLMQDGRRIRKKLIERRVYIPTLWPEVFDICGKDQLEYRYAADILPLPVDQRYDEKDMQYVIDVLRECMA